MTDITETIYTRLRNGFNTIELNAILRKSGDVTSLNKFIKSPATKRSLEVAIDNGEREKKGLKKHPFKTARPRARSTADISSALRRTQFEHIPYDFLHFAFANHFTSEHPALLVQFLGLINIPCDQTGRVHEEYVLDAKFQKPQALNGILNELLKNNKPNLVYQYLITLHALQAQFGFVSEYFPYLKEKNDQIAITGDFASLQTNEVLQTECVEGVHIEDQSTEELDDVDATSIRWEKLREDISHVCAQLNLGIVPDPSIYFSDWQTLHTEISSRQIALGLTEETSLAQLKLAESEKKYSLVTNALTKLTQLKETKSEYASAAHIVREDSQRLVNLFPGEGIKQHEEKIDALMRLFALVKNENGSLPFQDMQALHKALETEFDPAVAVAALLGGFVLCEELSEDKTEQIEFVNFDNDHLLHNQNLDVVEKSAESLESKSKSELFVIGPSSTNQHNSNSISIFDEIP